jgi:hypothetical protein
MIGSLTALGAARSQPRRGPPPPRTARDLGSGVPAGVSFRRRRHPVVRVARIVRIVRIVGPQRVVPNVAGAPRKVHPSPRGMRAPGRQSPLRARRQPASGSRVRRRGVRPRARTSVRVEQPVWNRRSGPCRSDEVRCGAVASTTRKDPRNAKAHCRDGRQMRRRRERRDPHALVRCARAPGGGGRAVEACGRTPTRASGATGRCRGRDRRRSSARGVAPLRRGPVFGHAERSRGRAAHLGVGVAHGQSGKTRQRVAVLQPAQNGNRLAPACAGNGGSGARV